MKVERKNHAIRATSLHHVACDRRQLLHTGRCRHCEGIQASGGATLLTIPMWPLFQGYDISIYLNSYIILDH